MGQLSRLLGRPKCFSGCEDEWRDWSLKFGSTAAKLSDHASAWMGDALKMNAEITLDQPNQRHGFLCDSCIPCSFICVRDEHWRPFEEHQITTVWKRGDCFMNGISRRRGRGVGSKEQFVQRMKNWENATLECNRTSSAPLQEEVLVATVALTTCVLERRGRHQAQRRLLKRSLQTLCRWMLMPRTVKVARVRKAMVKASSKVTETNTTATVRASSQSCNVTLMGIATSVVSTDTRNQTVQARANSSMASATSVEHLGTRESIVLSNTKQLAHLESPNQ